AEIEDAHAGRRAYERQEVVERAAALGGEAGVLLRIPRAAGHVSVPCGAPPTSSTPRARPRATPRSACAGSCPPASRARPGAVRPPRAPGDAPGRTTGRWPR